jgi:hypothetical protein
LLDLSAKLRSAFRFVRRLADRLIDLLATALTHRADPLAIPVRASGQRNPRRGDRRA